MPLLRRKRVLAAKSETTIGTPISLGASDAVFNVFDATIQQGIPFIGREGQSSFAPITGSLGAYMGTLTFSTDLIPGSGAVPAWASTLLPACGYVVSTATYTPRTEAPGSNVKTLTMGLYENGLYKQIHGAMGTFVVRFVAGEPVRIDWTFTGIWSDPSDVAIIAPTYPTVMPLRFVSSALDLGGATTLKVREVTIDAGNEVVLREDSTTSTGYVSALITGRRITGTIDPEAELVATKDFYTELTTLVEQELEIVLASAGIGATFNLPKIQFTNIQEADRSGIQVDNLEFQANRSAAAGDDEMSIIFDHTA